MAGTEAERAFANRPTYMYGMEPLNFMDIYSRMQIEQLIREFSPTMVFVEHDRAFMDIAATKKVQL